MSEDVFTPTGDNDKESVMDSLVGEGKKYKTVEDLAKSRLEADSFIEKLEGENKSVREQMAELEGSKEQEATIADLVKAVRESQKQVSSEDHQVTDEDLSKKIKDIMQGETATATRKQNREQGNKLVLDKVKGDTDAARSYVAERAKQLGMSVDALGELSETSPSAFAKLIEVDPSKIAKSIASLDGKNPIVDFEKLPETILDGTHTKAHYDSLKKEMGIGAYWRDSKVQGDYYNDAMKLGDRFFNQ